MSRKHDRTFTSFDEVMEAFLPDRKLERVAADESSRGREAWPVGHDATQDFFMKLRRDVARVAVNT